MNPIRYFFSWFNSFPVLTCYIFGHQWSYFGPAQDSRVCDRCFREERRDNIGNIFGESWAKVD